MKRYAGFRLAAILLLLISAPFCGAGGARYCFGG